MKGTRLIERAFKANPRNSAAANALCELLLQKGDNKRVSFGQQTSGRTVTYYAQQAFKLAERTIQFADVKGILCDGYIRAGRVCHKGGLIKEATAHFNKAKEARQDSVLATVGLAQMQLKNGERGRSASGASLT